MAFQLATAFVRIGVKGVSSLVPAFSALKPLVMGVTAALGNLIRKLEQLAIIAAVAFGAFAVAAVKAGSDAVELENLFAGVFKEGTAEAKKFAETMAVDLSRGVLDLMQQMANFQDTFVPLGFAREEATQLSKQMLTLVQDVSSFRNVKPAETANLFTSALVGNHRAVRRFGIVITEASLETELFNRGIKDGLKTASRQEKALARLAIMVRDSRDAMGDAAKTAGSFENRMRGLGGIIKDVTADMGKGLLPALANIAGAFTDSLRKIQPAVQKWALFVAKIGKVMTTEWDLTWSLMSKIQEAGVSIFNDVFSGWLEKSAFLFGRLVKRQIDFWKFLFRSAVSINKQMWDAISETAVQGMANFKAFMTGRKARDFGFDSVIKIPMEGIKSMGEAFAKGLGVLDGSFDEFFGLSDESLGKIEQIKNLMRQIGSEAAKLPDGLFDVSFTPDVPALKVAKLEAGEVIFPQGFIDFDKANEKIQEALLKADDVEEDQLQELKEGNKIAQNMVLGIKKVADKLDGGGVAGNIPVATQ